MEVENNCSPQTEVLSEPKTVITATKKDNKNNMAEVSISSRNVKFTSDEDESLKKGILKYGRKSWARILKDDELMFHSSRTRDSLRMRAESRAFKQFNNPTKNSSTINLT